MRRAMELAVLCNAQVGLVLFDGAGARTQFSTAEMEAVMEQYARGVVEPHERYTPMDVRAPACLMAGAGRRGRAGCSDSGRRPSCRRAVRRLRLS